MSSKDLNLSEKDLYIYTAFIDWLKQTWYGVPVSDSLLPYITTRYTPEEAALLTGFPFAPKTLAELAQLTNTDAGTLRQRLDGLAVKGLVYKYVKDGTERYCLNDIYFTFRTFGWPGNRGEYDHKAGPALHHYLQDGLLTPFATVKEKGLRVIPIETAIEDTRMVLPYEELVKVLDNVEYFSVSHCPCRHANNLDPDSPDCKYPTEVCLHFDKLGRYIVENGMGREITRAETEEILRLSAEAGLIPGISNQQEKPDTICNCCRDCCIWFLAMKKYGHTGTLTPSNYRIAVDQSTCTGCGLCVKRCPMEALHLDDMPEARGRKTLVTDKAGNQRELSNKTGKAAGLDVEQCIGCGLCAYKCPSHSLTLERSQVVHHPPQTGRDWMTQFIADTQSARQDIQH